MTRVSLSGKEQSIEFIWEWFEDQKEALLDFRSKTFVSILDPSKKVHSKFIGLTIDELNDYFEKSEEELEHLVCFDLISATEAILRSDFFTKVYNKDKTELGRMFRGIEKNKGTKIALEEDIIDNWKKVVAERKGDFSNYLGLVKYRHWLAHGRYWKPKLGQKYTPLITYNITENIFDIINDY